MGEPKISGSRRFSVAAGSTPNTVLSLISGHCKNTQNINKNYNSINFQEQISNRTSASGSRFAPLLNVTDDNKNKRVRNRKKRKFKKDIVLDTVCAQDANIRFEEIIQEDFIENNREAWCLCSELSGDKCDLCTVMPVTRVTEPDVTGVMEAEEGSGAKRGLSSSGESPEMKKDCKRDDVVLENKTTASAGEVSEKTVEPKDIIPRVTSWISGGSPPSGEHMR